MAGLQEEIVLATISHADLTFFLVAGICDHQAGKSRSQPHDKVTLYELILD